MFMQVATLAVQNSTARENMGTATSTVTFFRSIGSSLGGAIFGSILISRLTQHIHEQVPNAGPAALSAVSRGVGALSPDVKAGVLQAYVMSFHDMFLLAIPFTVAAFIVALFLREAPLRDSTSTSAAVLAEPSRT
jgi:hypothetical protein